MCFRRVPALLFCVAFLASHPAFPQAGRGSISGLVTDESGAIIVGATVQAANSATGITFSATSSGSGLYSFTSLTPGTYKLTVTQPGFQTAVQDRIQVTVD